MKHRKERVERQLLEELNEILQFDLEDERLDDVRVSRVRCSGDLRTARVGILLTADDNAARRSTVLTALAGAVGAIRTLVGDRVSGRFVPDFLFHVDESGRLLAQLAEIDVELSARDRAEPDEAPGPEHRGDAPEA